MIRPHVYFDERMLAHDPGPEHPEAPWRLGTILNYLKSSQILFVARDRLRHATVDELTLVHATEYVQGLLEHRGQAMTLDHETILSAGSVDAALLAAGGAIMLAEDMSAGRVKRGFALVRPPGHHASIRQGMGYCIFNNIALAASTALRGGCERVMIVDWDAHHGNGTEDIFSKRSDILLVSIHQDSLFPVDRGAASGTGRDLDRKSSINVPLPPGAGNKAYLEVFEDVVVPAADRFRPDIIFVSCGFDAHANDPTSALCLDTAGFEILTHAVVRIADASAKGRVGLILEGGYDVGSLGPAVGACLAALSSH